MKKKIHVVHLKFVNFYSHEKPNMRYLTFDIKIKLYDNSFKKYERSIQQCLVLSEENVVIQFGNDFFLTFQIKVLA